MKVKLNSEVLNKIFAVPSEVVEKHINTASGLYFKILLIILNSLEKSIEIDEILKIIGGDKSDIKEALAYWEKAGIISLGENKQKTQEIEFRKSDVKIITNNAPVISSAEIAQRIKNNKKVSFLCNSVQRMFARPLTTTEQRSLLSLYDWAGIPVDVILIAVEYCMAIEKSNVKYIEKTATSWYENGIDDHDKAEEYLKHLLKRDKELLKVKVCFGITNRNLSSNEQKFVSDWINKYNFDINILKVAFDKMVDQIGKVSFPYIDKILKTWYENGIKNVEQATVFDDKKPINIKKPTTQSKQTSFSDDAFEKLKYNIPTN